MAACVLALKTPAGHTVENSSTGDERSQAADGDSESTCRLTLNAATVDFGTVVEDTRHQLPVQFTNPTSQPIRVVSASASCGCTSVLTEMPLIVPPKSSRDLMIQMDTRNNVGELQKNVSVFVLDRNRRYRFQIAVVANSIPLMSVSRRQFDFGMLRDDATASEQSSIQVHKASVLQHAAAPVSIVSIPAGVQAELTESSPADDSSRQWNLTVTVDGRSLPVESIDDDLVIRTPSTVESLLRIPIRAKPFSHVRCVPGRIDFGVIRDDSPTSRTLDLQCDSGHEYRVEGVQVQSASAALSARLDEESHRVVAELDLNTLPAGFFKAQVDIHFTCDDGRTQLLRIPVSGYRLQP